MNGTNNTACVVAVLAAGASRRFGSPKQLAPINGKAMLLHVLEQTAALGRNVVCVLGAHSAMIQEKIGIKPDNVEFLVNDNWQEGIASSIRYAAEYTQTAFPENSALLLTLGDQPFISSDYFLTMINTAKAHPSAIIATNYNGSAGVPALFPQKFYPELMRLHGDEGAKRLLSSYSTNIVVVHSPDSLRDIDLPDKGEN